jgi:hypothetical protein
VPSVEFCRCCDELADKKEQGSKYDVPAFSAIHHITLTYPAMCTILIRITRILIFLLSNIISYNNSKKKKSDDGVIANPHIIERR